MIEPAWVKAPAVRWWIAELFFIYVVCALLLVWSPSQGVPGGPLADLYYFLRGQGFDVPYSRLEKIMNVVLFLPLGLLGSLLWPRVSVAAWGAISFGASTTIELVQALLLTQRVPTVSDVAANTLGGLSGAALVWAAAYLGYRVNSRRFS